MDPYLKISRADSTPRSVGKKSWAVGATNAFSVAILDTNADGVSEIVHSDGMLIRIRNASGKKPRTFQPSR